MRRAVLALALLLGGAGAHETQSAGPVQVTFSTEADDALYAAQPTQVRFVLTRVGDPLPSCRCRLLVYRGVPSARVAPVQDVRLDALQQGRVSGVVPALPEGAYTVVLDGRPVSFGDFEAFRLQYVVAAR